MSTEQSEADDANAKRQVLRSKRKAYGLSQKDLAELAGIDHTTISRFERGASDMSPAVHQQVLLVFEAMARMQQRIDQAADSRKRHPDFDEKAGRAAKALGMADEMPPADSDQLREWRKRMYPVFKKRVDVGSTEMEGGGTVGEYHLAVDRVIEDFSKRKRELEEERDLLKSELQAAREELLAHKEELIETYRRVVALEKELAEERVKEQGQ